MALIARDVRSVVSRSLQSKKSDFSSHSHRKNAHAPRYVTGIVDMTSKGLGKIVVTCLHLHHAKRDKRLREIEIIQDDLGNANLMVDIEHIMAGDFNALTRTDYTENEWQEIGRIRSQNRWEKCFTDETDYVKNSMGFRDCKDLVLNDIEGPLSTCKFNTRIDYIFYKGNAFGCQKIQHFDSDTSDHNAVVCHFNKKH